MIYSLEVGSSLAVTFVLSGTLRVVFLPVRS